MHGHLENSLYRRCSREAMEWYLKVCSESLHLHSRIWDLFLDLLNTFKKDSRARTYLNEDVEQSGSTHHGRHDGVQVIVFRRPEHAHQGPHRAGQHTTARARSIQAGQTIGFQDHRIGGILNIDNVHGWRFVRAHPIRYEINVHFNLAMTTQGGKEYYGGRYNR